MTNSILRSWRAEPVYTYFRDVGMIAVRIRDKDLT